MRRTNTSALVFTVKNERGNESFLGHNVLSVLNFQCFVVIVGGRLFVFGQNLKMLSTICKFPTCSVYTWKHPWSFLLLEWFLMYSRKAQCWQLSNFITSLIIHFSKLRPPMPKYRMIIFFLCVKICMKKCLYFSFFVLVKNFQAHKAALFKDPPPLQESQDYSRVFCLKKEASMFLTRRRKAWKCHFQQAKT